MTNDDELQEKWAEHDRKLDALIWLNRRILGAATRDRARPLLKRLAVLLGFESIVQLAVIVALGSFLGSHIREPRFALPAAVLHLFAIASLATMVRHMILALRIDFGGPVAKIQREIEALRVMRIRFVLATLFAGPLLWMPLLVVVLRGVFGLDAYALFGVPWIAANLAFGIAFAAAALWAWKRFGDRPSRSPILQPILRGLAGYNLGRAIRFLTEISDFTDETDLEA
jgi:hypothetical protein